MAGQLAGGLREAALDGEQAGPVVPPHDLLSAASTLNTGIQPKYKLEQDDRPAVAFLLPKIQDDIYSGDVGQHPSDEPTQPPVGAYGIEGFSVDNVQLWSGKKQASNIHQDSIRSDPTGTFANTQHQSQSFNSPSLYNEPNTHSPASPGFKRKLLSKPPAAAMSPVDSEGFSIPVDTISHTINRRSSIATMRSSESQETGSGSGTAASSIFESALPKETIIESARTSFSLAESERVDLRASTSHSTYHKMTCPDCARVLKRPYIFAKHQVNVHKIRHKGDRLYGCGYLSRENGSPEQACNRLLCGLESRTQHIKNHTFNTRGQPGDWSRSRETYALLQQSLLRDRWKRIEVQRDQIPTWPETKDTERLIYRLELCASRHNSLNKANQRAELAELIRDAESKATWAPQSRTGSVSPASSSASSSCASGPAGPLVNTKTILSGVLYNEPDMSPAQTQDSRGSKTSMARIAMTGVANVYENASTVGNGLQLKISALKKRLSNGSVHKSSTDQETALSNEQGWSDPQPTGSFNAVHMNHTHLEPQCDRFDPMSSAHSSFLADGNGIGAPPTAIEEALRGYLADPPDIQTSKFDWLDIPQSSSGFSSHQPGGVSQISFEPEQAFAELTSYEPEHNSAMFLGTALSQGLLTCVAPSTLVLSNQHTTYSDRSQNHPSIQQEMQPHWSHDQISMEPNLEVPMPLDVFDQKDVETNTTPDIEMLGLTTSGLHGPHMFSKYPHPADLMDESDDY